MLCEFVFITENMYKCTKCGLEIAVEDDDPPIFPCSYMSIKSEEPGFGAKIKNFSKSLISHAKNNFVLAKDEEIERRFKICESCEFFKNQSCLQCGCPINRTRNYISKLSWDSEKCPIDKW